MVIRLLMVFCDLPEKNSDEPAPPPALKPGDDIETAKKIRNKKERKKELKGYVFGETHERHYRERM